MSRNVRRVTLSPEQNILFEHTMKRLGMNESEVIRLALFDFWDKRSMVTESLHKPSL